MSDHTPAQLARILARIAGNVISPSWWRYIFERPWTWRKVLCRMRGHPCGPIYYTSNPEATEPDWRCDNCGDYLS